MKQLAVYKSSDSQELIEFLSDLEVLFAVISLKHDLIVLPVELHSLNFNPAPYKRAVSSLLTHYAVELVKSEVSDLLVLEAVKANVKRIALPEDRSSNTLNLLGLQFRQIVHAILQQLILKGQVALSSSVEIKHIHLAPFRLAS